GGGYGGGYGTRSGWRRWLRPRPIAAAIAVLLALAVVGSVITYFSLDAKLTRQNVLVDYNGRPGTGSGTNWLITGSDSRQGLSRKQERKLATGHDVSGRRSDTIMILHMPAGGGHPVLISLPRDSWVPIPGYGYNKINAAYSFGGPKLLAETVQNVTGLRIEHYMGIGFGGFVRVVNAVGGVRMCLKQPLHDPAAGLHLHKGCQVLNGAEALGFVRSRHTYANQDLQRIQNQRAFLSALLRKLTGLGVIANPFRALPAASGLAGTLTVDKSTHLLSLLSVAFALRHPITTTVPIANAGYVTPSGEDAVLWDKTQALQLFRDLNSGKKIPKSLITGTKVAG
ncbi:MAG TPA: LCP family protein, partial [Streptosporangiaceae bacterium]